MAAIPSGIGTAPAKGNCGTENGRIPAQRIVRADPKLADRDEFEGVAVEAPAIHPAFACHLFDDLFVEAVARRRLRADNEAEARKIGNGVCRLP